MRRLFASVVLATAAFAPVSASALGGSLERPSLAMPTGTDLRGVTEVLSREEFGYVTGWFINAHSMLYYSGDADRLNRFLAALTACDEIDVSVRFSAEAGEARSIFPAGEEGTIEAPCQWSVQHSAWVDARRLTVTVYLGDSKIAPADLSLPAWRGGSTTDEPFPQPLLEILGPVRLPAVEAPRPADADSGR